MSTKDIVYIALFAAIIAALGVVPPLLLAFIPVPITAQSLGVMLCGSILGSKRGYLATVLFLVMVIIGLPVLAGGGGGIGVLLGPSGGFVLGWPIDAYMIGLLFERNYNKINYIRAFIYIAFGGILVMYLIGILWLSIVTGLGLEEALYGVLVFIPGDIVKVAIATAVSITVKRFYPLIS